MAVTFWHLSVFSNNFHILHCDITYCVTGLGLSDFFSVTHTRSRSLCFYNSHGVSNWLEECTLLAMTVLICINLK